MVNSMNPLTHIFIYPTGMADPAQLQSWLEVYFLRLTSGSPGVLSSVLKTEAKKGIMCFSFMNIPVCEVTCQVMSQCSLVLLLLFKNSLNSNVSTFSFSTWDCEEDPCSTKPALIFSCLISDALKFPCFFALKLWLLKVANTDGYQHLQKQISAVSCKVVPWVTWSLLFPYPVLKVAVFLSLKIWNSAALWSLWPKMAANCHFPARLSLFTSNKSRRAPFLVSSLSNLLSLFISVIWYSQLKLGSRNHP